MNDLFDSLTYSENVKYFDFSNNELGDEFIQLLASYVPQWKKMEYINISDNNISDENFEELNSALTGLVQLKTLDLHSNMITTLSNLFSSDLIITSLQSLYVNSIFFIIIILLDNLLGITQDNEWNVIFNSLPSLQVLHMESIYIYIY